MSQNPVILYACIHNAGRSVAAKLLTEYYAGGQVDVLSAGSEPGNGLNPKVTQELARRGISATSEIPTKLTQDMVSKADVVVTMGCGESCPVFPGKRYLDWEVEDPGKCDEEAIPKIVDEIDWLVRSLLSELGLSSERLRNSLS